jgi:DNA repair photolyase
MQLTVCSQRGYIVPGAADARCIDAQRLSAVARVPIAAKLQGNRAECGCYQCRDIGAYDTCPHGCAYCYAVSSPATAARRHRDHDPEGEFLFPPRSALGSCSEDLPIPRNSQPLV